MKKYIDIRIDLLLSFIIFVLLSAACKKYTTELPGNKAAVALNFFSTSDVMQAAYGAAKPSATAIFVDSIPKSPLPYNAGQLTKFPVFNYAFTDALEFPLADGGFMNFTSYNDQPGGHHLYFTDTSTVVVADTVIRPVAKSYTSVYLADAPVTTHNGMAHYYTLAVTENRALAPADKVGIRIVHLGPDAGPLTCGIVKDDGSQVPFLQTPLVFGDATPYQYVESSAAPPTTGLVKLSLSNAAGASFITGVPFTPGRSYVVIVAGFSNDQQRQVRSGTNPDGSPVYKTISISANLRAIIRKSY